MSAEAGQIFRPTPKSEWGIDGEIQFKDDQGRVSTCRRPHEENWLQREGSNL